MSCQRHVIVCVRLLCFPPRACYYCHHRLSNTPFATFKSCLHLCPSFIQRHWKPDSLNRHQEQIWLGGPLIQFHLAVQWEGFCKPIGTGYQLGRGIILFFFNTRKPLGIRGCGRVQALPSPGALYKDSGYVKKKINCVLGLLPKCFLKKEDIFFYQSLHAKNLVWTVLINNI